MNQFEGHNVEEEHFDLIQRLEAMWRTEPDENFSSTIIPSQIGPYRIDEIIGTGGMGVVYRSWDETLKQFVALKLLIRSSPSMNDVKRFQQEAYAVAGLSHPGIVTVYASGSHEGSPWIAMALIQGPTLEQKIKSNNQLEGRVAARLMLDVANAIHYAHQQGIIHRDLKPSNILIDDTGKPQICDFGLAKITENSSILTNTGEVIGSAAWMAPEQARGDTEKITERSDVYSIGAMLYQCLIGRPAFQSASHLETLRQVCDVDPVALRQLDPAIDRDLETICMRCLQKSPEQRFDNADELAKELKRYVDYEPIHSRPPRLCQQAIRWCRRKPQLATAVGLAFLLMAALAVGIPWLIVEQSLRRQATAEAEISRQIAETEKYFSTLAELRNRRPVAAAGWKKNKLAQLQSIVNLNVDGKDSTELRSILASVLSQNDLEEVATFGDGIDSGAIAFSPDGKLVALGEIRPDSMHADLKVYLYRIETTAGGDVSVKPWISRSLYKHADVVSKTVRRFYQGGGWEGVSSICFSNDSRRLVVATRHGRILEWNLTKPLDSSPRVIQSYGEGYQDKWRPINFSANDKLLAGMRGEGDLFPRIIDSQTGNPVWDSDRPALASTLQPFGSMDGGECMMNIYNDGHEKISNFQKPEVQKFPGPAFRDVDYVSSKQSSVIVDKFGEKRCSVYDFRDNRKTTRLRSIEDRYELVIGPKFGANTLTVSAMVFGKKDEQRLRVWDAISGAIDVELPILQSNAPMLAISQQNGYVLVGFNDGAKLYRISGPTANINLKTSTPFQAMTIGPRRIKSFAIDQSGQSIALLEAEHDKTEQRNVRILNLATGVERQSWAMHGANESEFGSLPLDGNTLSFDGPDTIFLASKLPGFHCRLSNDGILPTPKHFMPLVSADPELTSPKSAVWQLIVPQRDLQPPHGSWNISLSFRVPEKFFQNNISPDEHFLKVSTEINGASLHEEVLTAGEMKLGNSNWQLKNMSKLTKAKSGDTVTVKVKSMSRLVLENDSLAAKSTPLSVAGVGIEIGTAHLFGIRKSDIGTIDKMGNGDWLTTTDDPVLDRWSIRESDFKRWTDPINEFAQIRDISAGKRSAIAGTRWGTVFQFSDDELAKTELAESTGWKSIRQIDSLDRERSGGDTLEEIVSVDMDAQDKFAVAANRGGHLMLFNLANPDNKRALLHKVKAHENLITDIAVSPDGSTVCSSGNDRKLKMWRRDADRLFLFFELDSLDNPVAKMEMSPDGRTLYYLCEGDRGIRIIDLQALELKFEEMNLLEHGK